MDFTANCFLVEMGQEASIKPIAQRLGFEFQCNQLHCRRLSSSPATRTAIGSLTGRIEDAEAGFHRGGGERRRVVGRGLGARIYPPARTVCTLTHCDSLSKLDPDQIRALLSPHRLIRG
jgi:hypothetical protein